VRVRHCEIPEQATDAGAPQNSTELTYAES
jgi:hypothetical protein